MGVVKGRLGRGKSQGFFHRPSFPLPQTQAAKDTSGDYPFHPLALVTVVEALKTVLAACVLLATRAPPRRRGSDDPAPRRHTRAALSTLAAAAFDGRQAVHLAAPAALYAANGSLKLALQRHVDPTAARFVSNLKVLVVAALSAALLGRRFTRGQASALAVLVLGVAVFSLEGGVGGGSSGVSPSALATGVAGGSGGVSPSALATGVLAVTVPALAAVLSERGLKRDSGASLAAQTLFMSLVGTFLNGAALATAAATGHVHGPPLAGAATPAALTLIAANAAQGLSAAYFFRHLTTVAKKHSAVVATVGTALLSAAVLGAPLPPRFWVAAALVGLATESFYSQSNAPVCARCGDSDGKSRSTSRAVDLIASPGGADPEAGRLVGRTSPARR